MAFRPGELKTLQEHGHQNEYLKFNKLLKEKTLPMTNICYLLFLDVVKWYTNSDSHQMRYSNEVKQFWDVGLKLFKGKFLRFMSGWKNQGQTAYGRLDPQQSVINFAVPHRNQIEDSNLPKELKNIPPKVITEMIDLIHSDDPEQSKTYKLCVDGKKINVGVKHQTMGDINLWGYEGPPSLDIKKETLKEDMKNIEALQTLVSQLEMRQLDYIKDIPESMCQNFTHTAKDIIQRLSVRIRDLRTIKVTKEMTLEKLKKVCINEQLKTKYSYAISSIKTYLFQIGVCIDRLLRLVESISYAVTEVNRSSEQFCEGPVCDLSNQGNYVCFTGMEKEVPSEEIKNVDFMYVKQRSELWKEIRGFAKVTGSTLHTALGLNGLKKQQQHYDNVFKSPSIPEFTAFEKQRMQYGVDNEINATATLVSKVLPVFFPDMVFVEEGCHVQYLEEDIFLVVSPDGVIKRQSVVSDILKKATEFGVEIKCPFRGKIYTTPVYYKMPYYYAIQVLSQMAVQESDYLLFVCYSTESSSVFKAEFDRELWQCILEKAKLIYGGKSGNYPKKLSSGNKELTNMLKNYCDSKVEFICEVKSVKAKICSHEDCSTDTCNVGYNLHGISCQNRKRANTVTDIQSLLFEMKESTNEAYSLCRHIASEVLVFLVSDLDRLHMWERQYSVPVGYAMKGYSMTTDIMRKMIDDVLKACYERGLYVPVVSYDGQWYNMAVRSNVGKPLTMLQLQKDIFKEAKTNAKSEIVRLIIKANVLEVKSFDDFMQKTECSIIRDEFGNIIRPIVVASLKNGERPFTISKSTHNLLKQTINKNTITPESEPSDYSSCEKNEQRNALLDTLPTEVAENLDDNVMDAMTNVSIQKEKTNIDHDLSNDMQLLFSQPDGDSFGSTEFQNTVEIEMEVCTVFESEDERMETELEGTGLTASTSDEILSEGALSSMLANLSNVPSRSNKWKNSTISYLKQMLKSVTDIKSSFTREELKVCLTVLQQQNGNIKFSKSWNKDKLVEQMDIALFRPDDFIMSRSGRRRKFPLLSLKTICKRSIAKIPKSMLNIIYAEHIFPERLIKWKKDFIFIEPTAISRLDTYLNWYSIPEYIPERYIQTFQLLDCHHLLTNARVKCCGSGMIEAGIRKEAWIKVAKDSQHNESGLSLALVEDLVDKQNNAYAQKTFSREVEEVMRENGDIEEANFCSLIREWYEAEDNPGLSAIERCHRRLRFREWLLRDVYFNRFPPPGNHVKGIPTVMYEGLMTNIERRIQIYPFVKQKTYNVRAMGSLEVENLFGEFQDLDPKGAGIMRPDDVPMAISNACELVNARLDPNRAFHMHTSRSKVYPIHELIQHSEIKFDTAFVNPNIVDLVEPRNHIFDLQVRGQRRFCKRKRGDISKPGMTSRGAQPIRQHHRCDETKILPHIRLGIDLNEEQ